MKKIMLGNEAVARGLYEAGCRLVSSYPGTPSTEITEYAANYREIYAEWAVNEKVALETAIGASMAGGRAFAAMKHVGLTSRSRTTPECIRRRTNRIRGTMPRRRSCLCSSRPIPESARNLQKRRLSFPNSSERRFCSV